MRTAPDLLSWLSSLGYDVYTPLFLSAGYDLATVSRLTPEDLRAVGIQLPAHRHRIMSAIAKLEVSDGLPDFVPSSLAEWLRLIRLESYTASLQAQGYSHIQQVLRVSVEDLEDIGFYMLGHQKRLLLGIKRIRELRTGKLQSIAEYHPEEVAMSSLPPTLHSKQSFSSFHGLTGEIS